MDEINQAILTERQAIILVASWMMAAASGLTYAITESQYNNLCRLIALGSYSGFVGLVGALSVYVIYGSTGTAEFMALLVATFLGLLGKSVDNYKHLPIEWLRKKFGVEEK